jgi:3'-phosphoadenosine 5'-phosphosulfate sulfotransferase (PAPS reductase)/FAD synthetase
MSPTPAVAASPRAFSYGGGTQSTAALVLAAEARLDFQTFLFANVGEDSELPATLRYLREIAMPYADMHGIELVEVRKLTRDGTPQTLLQRIDGSSRSIPIPVRMGPGGAPGNRTCTAEFKIRVIEKELRRRGATKDAKAIVGIGISTDEPGRVGSEVDHRTQYQLRRYPLYEAGLSRADCQRVIQAAGLPLPPRSACWFCPFHSAEEWRRLARREPALFEKACRLEDKMHARGEALGRGEFYFTRYGVPLRDLFHGNELLLFDDEDPRGLEAGCDSGHCMT